ncbi:MAG: hypothetical protein WD076_06275, partial [Parvularculaceae bacterium]
LIGSAYLQKVKSGEVVATGIEGFYDQSLRERSFFMSDRLDPWALEFGKRNAIVRVYDGSVMLGDSVADFLSVVGLEGLEVPDGERKNASLAAGFVACIDAFDKLAARLPVRQAFIDALVAASADIESRSPIDAAFAARIFDDYRAENRRFANEYLTPEQAQAFLSEQF